MSGYHLRLRSSRSVSRKFTIDIELTTSKRSCLLVLNHSALYEVAHRPSHSDKQEEPSRSVPYSWLIDRLSRQFGIESRIPESDPFHWILIWAWCRGSLWSSCCFSFKPDCAWCERLLECSICSSSTGRSPGWMVWSLTALHVGVLSFVPRTRRVVPVPPY